MGYPFAIYFLLFVTGSHDLQLCHLILLPSLYLACLWIFHTIMLMHYMSVNYLIKEFYFHIYFRFSMSSFLCLMLILITITGKTYVEIKSSILICCIFSLNYIFFCFESSNCWNVSLDLPHFSWFWF